MSQQTVSIELKNVRKSYKKLEVLKGLSLSVEKGSILALLGPNGAGKTTTIRILSTLLLPDSGFVRINGIDVVEDPQSIQRIIGLTGQGATVDDDLTGEENLIMMGRLYHMNSQDTKERAAELLKELDLTEAKDRKVKTYSGGMRRRLDLAASLIASPPVIFLDEPTTGLDPPSRLTMWTIIEKLAHSGTTILLTTQHMEEADRLADRIIVIDDGKVIAKGTPDELKQRVGRRRLEITIADSTSFTSAHALLKQSVVHADKKRRTLGFASKDGISHLREILRKLETKKIPIENISLHQPTLDDVFLTLTGHKAESEKEEQAHDSKK